jgi:hypothetical protein
MRIREKKYKMGKCTCKNCEVEFEKPLTEIRRNKKLNRPNFCSRTCVGKNNSNNFGNIKISSINENKHLKATQIPNILQNQLLDL